MSAILTDIKSKLVLAREPGVDRTKDQYRDFRFERPAFEHDPGRKLQRTELPSQLERPAPGKAEIVSSYTRDASGGVSVGSLEIDTAYTMLVDGQNPGNGILSAGTTVNQPNGSGGTTPKTYYLVSGGTPAAGNADPGQQIYT